MKKQAIWILLPLLFVSLSVWALDPKAPRSERATGLIYVHTPNQDDKITLISSRDEKNKQKIISDEEKQVKVGDYLVRVEIAKEYTYEQDVTIRPTERHEVIVPGYGNLRINGTSGKITVYPVGSKKKIAQFKGGEIRTLPRGVYDIKIQVGKYILDQNGISVVTNTLREIDVK